MRVDQNAPNSPPHPGSSAEPGNLRAEDSSPGAGSMSDVTPSPGAGSRPKGGTATRCWDEALQRYKELVPLLGSPYTNQKVVEQLQYWYEHPLAPGWNTILGDRLTAQEVQQLREWARWQQAYWRDELPTSPSSPTRSLPAWLSLWLQTWKARSPWFASQFGSTPQEVKDEVSKLTTLGLADQAHTPPRLLLETDSIRLPARTIDRSTLQTELPKLLAGLHAHEVPRLNSSTSGSSGQPLVFFTHPFTVGCYDALLANLFARRGVEAKHEGIFVVQITVQKSGLCYLSPHSYFGGALFCKLILALDSDQGVLKQLRSYLREAAPLVLSSDPWSLQQLKNWGFYDGPDAPPRPRCIISTSGILTAEARSDFEAYLRCPIDNILSASETGPLALELPQHSGVFEALCPDLFIEALDGRLTLSGGRNPYLALLRYQPGDRIEALSGPESGQPSGPQNRPERGFSAGSRSGAKHGSRSEPESVTGSETQQSGEVEAQRGLRFFRLLDGRVQQLVYDQEGRAIPDVELGRIFRLCQGLRVWRVKARTKSDTAGPGPTQALEIALNEGARQSQAWLEVELHNLLGKKVELGFCYYSELDLLGGKFPPKT